MATKIRIQNFRAIENAEIELKPITILLGPNGSGKSSIFKLFDFLTANLSNLDLRRAKKTKYKINKNLDLGSFEEIVTNNDTSRLMSFEFVFMGSTFLGQGLRKLELYQMLEEVGLPKRMFPELDRICRPTLLVKSSVYKGEFDVKLEIRFQNSHNNKNLSYLHFHNYFTNDDLIFERKSEAGNLTERYSTICSNFLVDEYFESNNIRAFWDLVASQSINNQFKKELFDFLKFCGRKFNDEKYWEGNTKKTEIILNAISIFVNFSFNLPRRLNILFKYDHIHQVRNIFGSDKNRFTKILPISIRPSSIKEWHHLRMDDKVLTKSLEFPPDRLTVNRMWEYWRRVGSLLQRSYELRNNGFEATEEYIKQFKQLNIDFRNVKSLSDRWRNLFRIMNNFGLGLGIYESDVNKKKQIMVVTNSESFIRYSETSSGFQQFFPIIASLVLSSKEVIFIEQPELHLHPKKQIDIVELFVNWELIGRDGAIQYIIETHSEHIIRGLQIAIADERIDPSQVNFYYFDSDKASITRVIELKVDNLGNFKTPWPKGFFNEAAQLSLKLLEAQIRRN